MKIVFFGTPDYVVPILDALHKTFRNKLNESPIVAVVTQRPKPTGRKQILEYSPVDTWAHKKDIPIYFKAEELIKDGVEADVAVLESYGNILTSEVINYFPKGIVNIHPSLLPRWRGAIPVPATIIAGDTVTGGTAILLDEEIDHGPILSFFKEEVSDTDTTASLRERIFARSAEFLIGLLPAYLAGKVKIKKQDHKNATFTTRINKEEAFIPGNYIRHALDPDNAELESKVWKINFIKEYFIYPGPSELDRFIRAMDPWPVAWTHVRLNPTEEPKRIKILKAHLGKSEKNQVKLELDEVQLEGKDPVSWKQFRQGYPKLEF
jgi:methionyl-tRNA formyltransferase